MLGAREILRYHRSEWTYEEAQRVRAYYRTVLGSKRWQSLRAAAKKRAGGECERCLGTRRQKGEAFHLHHVTYDNLGREALDDVVLLCQACHRQEHAVL